MQIMNKNLQIHLLKENLGESADLLDLESETDSELHYNENYSNIKAKIDLIKGNRKEIEYIPTKKDIEAIKGNIQRYNQTEYGFKAIFKDSRIVGLAGIKNSGKTNNLIAMIKQFRKHNKDTAIYVYGFREEVIHYLKEYDCTEISELRHLIGKKDCLFICDEFQKLRLNDRRYTEQRDEFKDYVYHNNVYCLLSTPDPREFNSVIGGMIEKWCVKTLTVNDCVNGSQLKKAIEEYKGNYKHLGAIETPKDKVLVLNKDYEQVIECEYIKEVDTKLNNKTIFGD